MKEHKIDLGSSGSKNLRFMKKEIAERPDDSAFSFVVGDKAIRIYLNNLVQIADLEFIRAEEMEGPGAGAHPVAYNERSSWETQYPEGLSREDVMASIDFAFMSAGLPSIFYLTNLYLTQFETIEDERAAGFQAFQLIYPSVKPIETELNAILRIYGQDLFHAMKYEASLG